VKLLAVSGTNFGLFEEFNLSLESTGLVLLTGENRDTDGASSNGSGKTTLFKALTWCLYGETIDGDGTDAVIRRGAKETEVQVKIDGGDRVWTVVRKRTKKSGTLDLLVDGVHVRLTTKELETKIEKLVGLDFVAFKNTVLFGQNDSLRFADVRTTDGARKEMLHRVLRTGIFRDAEKWARDKAREVEDYAKGLEKKLAESRAKLEGIDLGALELRASGWALSRDRRKQILEEEATTLLASVEKRKKLAEEKASEAKKEVDAAEKRLAKELEQEVEDEEKLEELFEKARRVESDARSETTMSRLRSTSESDLLARLEKNEQCPICTSKMDEGDAKKHVDEIRASATKWKKAHDAAEKKSNEAASALEKLEKRKAVAKGLRKVVALRREEVSEAKEVLRSAEKELTSVGEIVAKALEKKKAAKAVAEEVNPFEASLEEARAKVEKLEETVGKIAKLSELKSKELAHYSYWVRGFGPQGLPSFVLDTVMPFLTERTNAYLEILADGDITMTFSSTSELKSGDVRDKIGISWMIEGVDDATPSGGQRRKMEIATDLALMDLAETREGGGVDLLLMDEVLDGLDPEGRDRVIELLSVLRTKRSSIFAISHEPLISEVFERSLTVVKEGGVSSIVGVEA
jgi:DNA repair exonuclease SbcCD ATPase subunit